MPSETAKAMNYKLLLSEHDITWESLKKGFFAGILLLMFDSFSDNKFQCVSSQNLYTGTSQSWPFVSIKEKNNGSIDLIGLNTFPHSGWSWESLSPSLWGPLLARKSTYGIMVAKALPRQQDAHCYQGVGHIGDINKKGMLYHGIGHLGSPYPFIPCLEHLGIGLGVYVSSHLGNISR